MRDALADLAHDLLAAREHRDRVAVADRLGERAQIGLDAVQLLYAAARDAKAGLDLVDQQDHAVFVAQLARRAQVLRFRRDAEAVAHDGLDQQAGDARGVALEHILELIRVVRLDEMRQAARADRHALAVGLDLGVARPATICPSA